MQQLVFDYLSDDGKLSLTEYREILCKLIIDDDFVRNIMNQGDTDGDGLLSISELVSYLHVHSVQISEIISHAILAKLS